MLDRITKFLTSYCRVLTLLSILAVLIPLAGLVKVRVDNSEQIWRPVDKQGASERSQQANTSRNLGVQYIVLAWRWDDPLSDSSLALQMQLAERVRAISSVTSVFDFAQAAGLVRDSKTGITAGAGRFLATAISAFSGNAVTAASTDWRAEVRNDPLLNNLLIGPDGHTVGMLIITDGTITPKLVIEQLQQVIAGSGLDNSKVFLAGMPLIAAELDNSSRKSACIFLPLAVLVGAVAMILVLRNMACYLAVSATIIVTMLCTVGSMFLSGRSMNMVTITLPGLIISLALAGNIHIVSHFLRLRAGGMDIRQALQTTIRVMLIPVFMTSLTTAVGFASVMISDLRPIQDFGLFAAIGIMVSCLLNFIMLPGLLSFSRKIPSASQFGTRHWTHCFAGVVPWHKSIIAGAIILLFAALLALPRLQPNNDLLSFLPQNSRVLQDYNTISETLTGLMPVVVEITQPESKPDQLRQIQQQLALRLEAHPLIAKALYSGQVTSFLAKIGPATLASAMFKSGTSQTNSSGLFNMPSVSKNDQSATVMLMTRLRKTEDLRIIVDLLEKELFQIDPKAGFNINGMNTQQSKAASSLIRTQIQSYLLAIIIILLLIGIFMRSVRAIFAAILPNALPVATMFAFMAVMEIPLDVATILIAGIATGIAADDTIHLLASYHNLRKQHSSVKETLISAFDQTGRSITWTSVIAASGFAILIFAPFRPIQYFGILASLTMIVAWLCDMVILPACIKILRLWEE